MNYEEKYNEILEWARKNKARLNGVPIEEVLPELAESEDEMIIDGMLEFFRFSYHCDDIDQKKLDLWIAYLEKQKEPENVSASTMVPSCWNSPEMTHEKIMGKTENREVHPYKARRQAALQYCSKVVKDDDPGKLRVICYYAFIAGVKWQRKQECGTSKVIPR